MANSLGRLGAHSPSSTAMSQHRRTGSRVGSSHKAFLACCTNGDLEVALHRLVDSRGKRAERSVDERHCWVSLVRKGTYIGWTFIRGNRWVHVGEAMY